MEFVSVYRVKINFKETTSETQKKIGMTFKDLQPTLQERIKRLH